MLLSSQFPINYFSVSEVDQWWSDFRDVLTAGTHKQLKAEPFWRFNRIHDYGAMDEDPRSLNIAVQDPKWKDA